MSNYILGIDEVGRGPVAGPVTISGVILPSYIKSSQIDDSKKLSEKQRQSIYSYIEKKAVYIYTVFKSPWEIDEYGINICIYSAMKSIIDHSHSLFGLERALIDGDRFDREVDVPVELVPKGDSIYKCIGAASIVAKVKRDEQMKRMPKKFNAYCWDSNKGYGTKDHMAAIEQYGLTDQHRRSFLNKYTENKV